MGRHPIYEDDPVTKPISLRVGLQQAVAINSIATARGCTRTELLRQSIDDTIEDEEDRPVFRADNDALALYDSLTLYQIRAVNSLSSNDPRFIPRRNR
jgi:hypothetical protein